MKRLIFLFVFLVISQLQVQAQHAEDYFRKIEAAFKANNASALEPLMNQTVEISLLGNDQTYAQKQAVFVLKEFFTQHPVKSFSFLHKGLNNNNHYAVGSYVSTNGAYDVNVYVKKHNQEFKIEQIRFEKDK
jgi:uncharacterized lipoprotein YajG